MSELIGNGYHKSHAVGGGAINKSKTHCPRGHEYLAENTIILPRGRGRACRICRESFNRRIHEKRKQGAYANG